jgi:prepilin-type N-terminal cleavage/methylation domain-containing protein
MATGHRPAAGFTLIELLAVVLIIGLIAGIALPNLSLGGGRVAFSEAQRLASVFGFARQRALATGQPHRVVIDLDDDGYWVEQTPESVDRFASNEPVQIDNGGRRVVQLAAPAFEDEGFAPLGGAFGRPHQLPGAVSFEEVLTLAAGALRGGQAAIRFEPDGSADPAEVVLRHEDGEASVLGLSRLADEVRIERE